LQGSSKPTKTKTKKSADAEASEPPMEKISARVSTRLKAKQEPNVRVLQPPVLSTDAVETPAHIPVPVPKAGDQFRFQFRQKDLFTKAQMMWFIGTAVSVNQKNRDGKGCSLQIQWSDQTIEDFEYPNAELESIVPEDVVSGSVYRVSSGNSDGASTSFAYDSNPSSVAIGDYVECCYQNGSSRGQWWPGRVASISGDGTRADVAYFDGEVRLISIVMNYFVKSFTNKGFRNPPLLYQSEIGIPLNEGKMHLIRRGSHQSHKWLINAEYPEGNSTGQSSRRHGKMTRIIRVYSKSGVDTDAAPGEDLSNDLWCEVKRADGKWGDESYASVVKALFSKLHADRQKDGKIILFPGYNPKTESTIAVQVNHDITTPMHVEESFNPDNPFAVIAANRASDDSEAMDLDISQDSFLDFPFNNNDDDDDADADTSRKRGPIISEMPPALANSCWRALNSDEPHAGFGILMHLESSWNSVPNDKLTQLLSEFLVDGPKSEGTRIRESHRTELAFMYMDKAMATLKLDDCKCKHRIGPSTESKLEQLLALPMNETNDAFYGKMSQSQTYRLAQGLQFSSKSLGFAAKSITMELSDIVSGTAQPTQKLLNEMPFASLFLKTDIRNSLKMVVKCAMKSLLRHGHWLTGYPGEGRRLCKTSHEQKCASECQSCIKAFGILISHVAWLYCAKEEIPFADQSCCFVIQDVVESELSSIDFVKLSTTGKKFSLKARNKYTRDMRLRFLFALDTAFSREMQMQLSQLFNLSAEASILLG